MPLLRNPDKSKLSKRKNPTSVTFYERMGFMPEAMLNYLGRMGWSMPDEREKFSLQEMVDNFDLSRVSLGGPIFDIEKLSWLNGQWLRDLPVAEFASRVQTWALNPEYMMKIAPHVQGRVETFSQIAPLAGFFFAGGSPPPPTWMAAATSLPSCFSGITATCSPSFKSSNVRRVSPRVTCTFCGTANVVSVSGPWAPGPMTTISCSV